MAEASQPRHIAHPRDTPQHGYQRPAKGYSHAGPAGCTGGNAQSEGISQRIAQHALQCRPGHSQSAAAQGGQAHTGKADAYHNPGQGRIIGCGRKACQCRQSAKHALCAQGHRPRQTGQRQRNKPHDHKTGKNRPQPAGLREGGVRRCGRSGHASPLAVACGGTRGPKRWLTSGVRPLPSGGLRRASIKKASSTRGGRGPYFLCPADKNPLPWGGQCRTVVPSFHDCALWGMAGLPAWLPCSGLPVSSGAIWSKVKNLTAAGPLPIFTGIPY